MATVQALRKDAAPPRTPERQALADAIAKREAAGQHLAKVTAAFEHAEASSLEIFRALKQARVALEDATAYEHANLVAAALGDANAGASIEEAKAALTKAEGDYDAAKKIADALQAEQRTAEDKLKRAASSLNDAVAAVLRASPEVVQLQNDIEIAKRALAAAIDKLLTLPLNASVTWDIGKLLSRKLDVAWAAAVEGLRGDADALLPQ